MGITHLDNIGADANEELRPCLDVNRLTSARLDRILRAKREVNTMATTWMSVAIVIETKKN